MSEYQWKAVSVVGFDELMEALERADRKGYMPDAVKEAWEGFNWKPAQQEPVAWQPIETAPKKEVKILLRSFSGLIAEGYFLRAAYNGVGGWVWPYIHQNPVHWMPLPPPPPIESAHGIKENT